jgi:hypothetical protein
MATDSTSEPTARRAFDATGTFQVCLTVVNARGRRSTNTDACGLVTVIRQTRARLTWRYRGWWYDPSDFCWDVPWDNQCPDSHGNARWEVLLHASQGDVPIRRAWATFTIEYWQTDDTFEKRFSYQNNPAEIASNRYDWRGQTRYYDFFRNDQKAWSKGVDKGLWRILSTDGTAASGWPQYPNLEQHPLVLNTNLGDATGAFDGGPHWVPDEAYVTLHVEDARGRITTQSGAHDHKRAEWRGSDCINGTSGGSCVRGFEKLVVAAPRPVGNISATLDGETIRLTGSGDSPERRVVDMYWEVFFTPVDQRMGDVESYESRASVLELAQEHCTTQRVVLYVVDDEGQVGSDSYTIPSRGSWSECSSTGPGDGLETPVRNF